MGWKASMIIINSDQAFDKDQFFASLRYFDLQQVETKYVESAINPDDNRIYLGTYKGNTIICMQDLPIYAMDMFPSKAEGLLSRAFPDTEIATFVLHSVINFWGYSITKNGEKLRVRAGSSEGGTTVEFGEPLEEEKQLFSQSKTNEAGQRIFKFPSMPNEDFTDDQVGENFVFDLSKRYLGEKLDSADSFLFETQLEGFSFTRSQKNNPVKKSSPPRTEPTPKKSPQKPWWKFW